MITTILLLTAVVLGAAPVPEAPQTLDRIVSEHVRVRMPAEREWLGHEVIMELERRWQFMNRTIGNMPRRVLLVASWETPETSYDYENATIMIGMDTAAASSDARSYLLHAAGRELARLGLLDLSRGAAAKEECRFLLEGMAKILVHDYEASNRNLGAAWVTSHMLDRMKLLGLAQQSQWSAFAGSRHTLITAAPGVTFLITCRELRGRESLLKFFDALKKTNLQAALTTAFRSRPAELESIWLQKVRDYDLSEEITATDPEDAPALQEITATPAAVRPGSTIRFVIRIADRSNDLLPEGLFVLDAASGKIVPVHAVSDRKDQSLSAEVPIEPERRPGTHDLLVTAVDESGNVRTWRYSYTVQN